MRFPNRKWSRSLSDTLKVLFALHARDAVTGAPEPVCSSRAAMAVRARPPGTDKHLAGSVALWTFYRTRQQSLVLRDTAFPLKNLDHLKPQGRNTAKLSIPGKPKLEFNHIDHEPSEGEVSRMAISGHRQSAARVSFPISAVSKSSSGCSRHRSTRDFAHRFSHSDRYRLSLCWSGVKAARQMPGREQSVPASVRLDKDVCQ